MSQNYNSPQWETQVADIGPLRLSYILSSPITFKGTILLLHGFPEASYQFRHVISPLTAAGYRVLAPDYRGAGQSSKPVTGYTKSTMASDIINLLTHLHITEKVWVVGYDIGAMIAYSLALRHPHRVAGLLWGDVILPGTSVYRHERGSISLFHVNFQSVLDLPEALVAGRERTYLQFFYDGFAHRPGVFLERDVEFYVRLYTLPGALRAAFALYRAFEVDDAENRAWWETRGRVSVPASVLNGEFSGLREGAEEMWKEAHQGEFEERVVKGSGHFLAEENPQGFVEEVLGFIKEYESS